MMAHNLASESSAKATNSHNNDGDNDNFVVRPPSATPIREVAPPGDLGARRGMRGSGPAKVGADDLGAPLANGSRRWAPNGHHSPQTLVSTEPLKAPSAVASATSYSKRRRLRNRRLNSLVEEQLNIKSNSSGKVENSKRSRPIDATSDYFSSPGSHQSNNSSPIAVCLTSEVEKFRLGLGIAQPEEVRKAFAPATIYENPLSHQQLELSLGNELATKPGSGFDNHQDQDCLDYRYRNQNQDQNPLCSSEKSFYNDGQVAGRMASLRQQRGSVTNSSSLSRPANESNSNYSGKLAELGRQARGGAGWQQQPLSSSASSTTSSASSATATPRAPPPPPPAADRQQRRGFGGAGPDRSTLREISERIPNFEPEEETQNQRHRNKNNKSGIEGAKLPPVPRAGKMSANWAWEPQLGQNQTSHHQLGQNPEPAQGQNIYYYYNQPQLNQHQSSLATTTTDELASDSSHSYQQRQQQPATTVDPVDYHYYQVVVPERLHHNDQAQNWPHPEPRALDQRAQSPCRSIQRLVSTLFSPQSSDTKLNNQTSSTMVSQEPLIRSSSWQNKTLINLSQTNNNGGNFVSPRSQQMMELNQLEQQQDHYYCALASLQQQQNYHQQLYANQQLHLKALPGNQEKLLGRTGSSDLLSVGGAGASTGLGVDQQLGFRANHQQKSKRPPGATRQCLLLALLLLAAALLLLFLLLASIGHQQQSNKLLVGSPEANNKAGARHELGPLEQQPPPISANGPESSWAKLGFSGLPPPAGQHQHQQQKPVIPNPITTTTTTTTTPAPPAIDLIWSESRSSRWRWMVDQEESQCYLQAGGHQFCGPKGRCDTDGLCYCQPGFSGPTCGQDDCESGCSQQGDCQLRQESPINQLMKNDHQSQLDIKKAALSSIGFSSLSASPLRNSYCLDNDNNSSSKLLPKTITASLSGDPRLEWRCECRQGFTGSDCSQQQELECSNGHDDDKDGLVDCEDDDCCQQPQCSNNVMCFQSPDPLLMLDTLIGVHSPLHQELQLTHQAPNASSMQTKEQLASFHTQMRFLIGINSTQSYAHESSLDKSRVAVIRGRVVKPRGGKSRSGGGGGEEGIVSVRVSVVNKVEYGFTLTRQDGHFDLLVNGSEWITLYFLRSAYQSVKRKLFVRPQTINLLQQDIEMWLASSATNAQSTATTDQPNQGHPRQDSFGLQLQWELNRWLNSNNFRRQTGQMAIDISDERRQLQLLDCIRKSMQQFGDNGDSWNQAEPRLATFATSLAHNSDNLLNTFVLANEGAYEAKIALHQQFSQGTANHSLLYNSASFGPASSLVKPLLSIKLLDSSKPLPPRLSLIHLQLDIEGQSKREQLEPKRGLTYQFAWNRRNVYHQKVYGFGQLNLRLGYQYELPQAQANQTKLYLALQECLSLNLSGGELAAASDKLKHAAIGLVGSLDKRVVWFERRLHLEGHQMNQQADLGKWQLDSLNRYDPERQLLYLGTGRSLPFKLTYPPVVVTALDSSSLDHSASSLDIAPMRRHLSRGPNSMFVVVRGERLQQLDSTGKRRLLDLPLSSLTSGGFNQPPSMEQTNGESVEILFNNQAGLLYISSRQAGKILQVSYASLLVLNKTLVGHSPTAAPDDEIDIEVLSGFGQLQPSQLARPAKQVHLEGPHSMALDEERQLLYFADGSHSLVALDLLTRRLALLATGQPDFEARQSPPLCHLGSRLPLTEFRPHKMEALTWARSESSLLFLDRNMLYALRQDLWLELLAIGTPSPCAAAADSNNLGNLRELTMDADDLIIAHQWTIEAASIAGNGQKKTTGRFYLAKMRLGLRIGSNQHPIFDLHSSQQTWDPMIWRLAATNLQPIPSGPLIDWQRLARRPIQVVPVEQSGESRQSMQQQQASIPFIHLLQGFRHLDSLETNTDGSIFALTDGGHSIKMIVAYSPNEFNSIERYDVNINRLFAVNQPPAESLHQQQQQQQLELDMPAAESTKLNVILVEEPTTRQLLEFHSFSGLQLSSKAAFGGDLAVKSEFYYRILTNNKMIELDEDDKYDFQVQKLILNYMWHTGNLKQHLNQLTGAYVRLNRILDSDRNDYELQRLYTGSRFVLQSIQFNQQPLCEAATDYQGLLTTYQSSTKDVWLELVYDGQTYLLRDIVSKLDGSFSQPSSQLNINNNHNNKLKRIVYDRVFHHYCDLFIVDTA